MASPSSNWTLYLQGFVDPDRPPAQQKSSRDALIKLLKHNNLSISQIVKEMGEFLTTTDSAVRARGILLLGELWMHLGDQQFEEKIIHNFANFFSSRLADWHALHGALLGSLALLRRRKDAGSVQEEDAKLFVKSTLENLQVQALAQQDRMLCLELYECLLQQHSNSVLYVGDRFMDGVCAAIDGEKDPRCLLLVFHIVELVAKLFPDCDGPLGSVSEEVFNIISCYFPVSFNPPPDDIRGITRDDLSMALMHCFASTSLFADFCIPLLLEKLSSTLRTAKRESLKYLGFCSLRYGAETLQKHGASIWQALRTELFSQHGELGTLGERSEEITRDTLKCVTSCVKASEVPCQGTAGLKHSNSFLELLLHDACMEDFFKCLPDSLYLTDDHDSNFKEQNNADDIDKHIHLQSGRSSVIIKETSHVLGAAIQASHSCCFLVLNSVMKRFFEHVLVPIEISSTEMLAYIKGERSQLDLRLTGPSTMVILESVLLLVEAANSTWDEYLLHSHQQSNPLNMDLEWLSPLKSFSADLVTVFSAAIVISLQGNWLKESSSLEKLWRVGVAGLQAVASFPLQVSVLTQKDFAYIIQFLLGIILRRFEWKLMWNGAVECLSIICKTENNISVYMPREGFFDMVASSLLEDLMVAESGLPVASNLKALAAICSRSPDKIAAVTKQLTDMVYIMLKEANQVNHEKRNSDKAVLLLRGLAKDVLPCVKSMESESEWMLQLSLGMWNIKEMLCGLEDPGAYQVLDAGIDVVRLASSKCNEPSQRILLFETLAVVDCTSLSMSTFTSLQGAWVLGVLGSLVIALHPSIHTVYTRDVLHKLLTASAYCPCISDVAAQAVGSMLNKWPEHTERTNDSLLSFASAIDIVMNGEWLSEGTSPKQLEREDEKCTNHVLSLEVKLRCIRLLAWIGKGLAMRGHSAVSDIAALMLGLLHSNDTFKTGKHDFLLKALWPEGQEASSICSAAEGGLALVLKDVETSMNAEHYAFIRPVYKQRFFISMLPPLILAIKEGSPKSRIMLFRLFGNLVSLIPTSVIVSEGSRVLPLVLDSLSDLSNDQNNADVLLSTLLALSAMLVDKNVGDLCCQHLPKIISCLVALTCCPFSMMVRETALLCLGAVVALPYTRVFPFRTQVLKVLTSALDDRKRAVRREAIRCRQAWDAISC